MVISPRSNVMSGWLASAADTAAEKPSRSTASAPPAGTWLASAARMTSEPSRRISSCSRPTALWSLSSERNEFEQTSFGIAVGFVRRGRAQRPHFVQRDGNAVLRELPGSLGTGKAAANDMNRLN